VPRDLWPSVPDRDPDTPPDADREELARRDGIRRNLEESGLDLDEFDDDEAEELSDLL
jgi:hypothetical protein